MKSIYIDNKKFNHIYTNLNNEDSGIVKLAIQELITNFEQANSISNLSKRRLIPVIYVLLKHNSSNLRKWVYHLCYYQSDKIVLDRILYNIISGFETNIENLTWAIALLSQYPEYNVYNLYDKYLYGKITEIQFNACISAMPRNEKVRFNENDMRIVLGSDDKISKIWLTKIYVCNRYIINYVNDFVMNELLDDTNVTRYALWAFSTQNDFDANVISKKPEDIKTFDDRSIGWYFICIFKDYNFILKNQDYITSVLNNFFYYPKIVRIGILKGILYSDYQNDETINRCIFSYLMNIFSSIGNIRDNYSIANLIILSFLKYKDMSESIEEFLDDILSDPKFADFYDLIISLKGKKKMGDNFFANNMQVIKGDNNGFLAQGSPINFDASEYNNKINNLIESIEKNKFDDKFENDEDINAIINGIEANIQTLTAEQKSENEIAAFLKCFHEFSQSKDSKIKKKKKRKEAFLKVLSALSSLCTILKTIPTFIPFFKNVFVFILSFFGI